ncbi:MAG: TolC family protein [Bacteroidetes bacterium]|nr:TolC family protein [Bacteroidota bacterium]
MRIVLTFILILLLYPKIYSQECTLAGYLDKGVSNSPVLKDLSNQILSNHYDSLIARAACLPQVNFNGYLMYAPSVNGWGYSDVITNGQNLIGTLNASQQILNKKTREINFEKFGIASENLTNTRKISLNELKKAITAQYLTAFSALEERKFQQMTLATLVNEATILKAWTEKGIYRQTDYLSLKVEILNLEQNIRDLDLRYHNEFWNLNLICGVNDTSSCDLKLPVISDTLIKTIENSMFFRQFLIDSLTIVNKKLLDDSRYKPVVSWFADGGIINNEPQYLYQNFGISIGLSMTIPVFDGNQRKINYDKIHISEETRRNYRDNFRFRYGSQLKQLQFELEKTRLLLKENDKQISLIQELIAADRIMLNAGSLSITDYILALNSLIDAKHAGLLYQIRTQYILNEINFWKQ